MDIRAKVILVGGSSSRTMAKKTCELCKKQPHVVILPTARGDDPEIVDETYGFYSQFAKSVDVLKLVRETPTKEEVRDRLRAADLIYTPGGNMESVIKHFEKYEAGKWILEAAADENKVIVGSSAGAMVLSHTCFEDYDNDYIYDTLSIIKVWFSPHYQMEEWKRFDNFLLDKSEPTLAFAAGDDAGILCENGRYYTFFGEEGNSVWRFTYNKETGKWDRVEYPAPADAAEKNYLTDITPE